MKKPVSPRQNELRRIVASAGSNNRERGITGGLMFNRNYFGQVLEGDRASVSDLFCRIAKDPRHCSVVIVEATVVQKRIFDRWAMGLAERNETAEKLNSKYRFERGFDPTKINSGDFLDYILEMVQLEDQLVSVPVPTWQVD